ncbi:MAG: Kelch repeat-containing protein [Acidimicrobiales bacterium]
MAPVPATEVGAARFDGRIWVIGGFSGDGSPLDVVQVYDPADDSWSTGPALPVTVHHAAVVASDDGLMVVGGYSGGGFGQPTDSVWVLRPDADDWVPGSPLPSPRGAGAGAWDGNNVLFGGGADPDGPSAEVWALEGDVWRPVGELSEARDHLGAASDGEGRVWFMGGRFGSLDSNRATVDLVDNGRIGSATSLPTPRGGAAGFHAPAVGACLAGGEAPDGTFDVVECIDPDGRTTTLAPLDQARHGLGAAVADGVAYTLLGGPEPGLAASDAVEALPVR